MFHAHEKGEYVSMRLTAEAVKALGCGEDHEGGILVIMEWAPGGEILADRSQGQILPYYVLDPNGRFEPTDLVLSGCPRGRRADLRRQR
jgi:hypothetical protein